MKPLAPNTLLQNRYLIVHLIGKGGMGEVYLAVDQRLGSAVALKRTFFSDDEALVGAFEREARTLARLRHPVLPKVSDHFIENDNQFLVMEHIAGEDLSKRLEASQKPFPLSWVLFWADQLLDALSYLHSHEPPILHRDIKPQNLKLTNDNNIILLDFGLSKNTLGDTKISSSGSVGFTPHYAPMEQIRGTGTSPRSDIYSLSATLYQLLTNNVPPDALSRADALLNGSPDPLTPVEKINSEVIKVVSDVILKGMAVSQEQRFSTAREMQKELRDAYAQMQKAMSAQTVAFNAQGEQFVPDAEIAQGVTESAAAKSENQTPVQQAHIKTQAISPAAFDLDIPQGETVPYGAKSNEEKPVQDFDQTLAYDSEPPHLSSQSKQSDIKTEVFLNDFVAPKEAPREQSAETNQNFSPDATEPLIQVNERTGENQTPPTVFNAPPATDVFASVPPSNETEDFSIPEEQYQKEERHTEPPPPAPPVVEPRPGVATEKKSKGKGLAIAAGLFALLILTIGAAGFGWYAYSNSMFGLNPKPTPAPTVESTPAALPSPSPTPEPTIEANANTDLNSNTNTEITSGAANTQTNVQQGAANRTPTPRPTVQPTVQTTVVRPTPRKTEGTAGSTPRPTPARTPKRDERTVILQ